jgi:hypothetical protein
MKKRKKYQMPNSTWKPSLYTSYHSVFQRREKKSAGTDTDVYVKITQDISQKQSAPAKYFDYSAQTTRRKIFRLLRLQHRRLHQRRLRLATLGGSSSYTRANYRQRSGARHQLAPECENSRSRPAISSTSSTRRSQQRSGARQQLRLRS